ncbi:MAG: hypothetical protein C0493_00125 [Kytococcus sp.]|nr:hypothetical protein [Kytococcus sp.]
MLGALEGAQCADDVAAATGPGADLDGALRLGDRGEGHLVVGLQSRGVEQVGGDRGQGLVEGRGGVGQHGARGQDRLESAVRLAEGVLSGPGGRDRRRTVAGLHVLLPGGDETARRLDEAGRLLDVGHERGERIAGVGRGQPRELLLRDRHPGLDLSDPGPQRGEELRDGGLQVAQPGELGLLGVELGVR